MRVYNKSNNNACLSRSTVFLRPVLMRTVSSEAQPGPQAAGSSELVWADASPSRAVNVPLDVGNI